MGADFLLASLVIDKGRNPNFVAGYAAIKRLGPDDIEAPEEFFGDDPDTEVGMAAIRETIRSALGDLEHGLASREVECICVRGATVYVTGGMSYGEAPTELFDTVARLRAVKGVLTAVGFEDEP